MHDRPPRTRSKTLAAWLAVLGGSLGLHRFYLHGLADRWGWLHAVATALGLVGLRRIDVFGQDDRWAWLLLPLLGLGIAAAALAGIMYALTPDERWNDQHNAGHATAATGWLAVLAAIAGLMLGATALLGAIAYGGQKFFEWQLEPPPAQNSSRLTP